MVHIIAYDLKSPNDTEDDYKRLIDGLKSAYDTWCHLEESVWLISTEQTAHEVRDTLKGFLQHADVLFVGRLSGSWGSVNLGSARSKWLKDRGF